MAPIPVINMGAVSAAGRGVDNGYRTITKGKRCLTPFSLWPGKLKKIPLIGEVKEDFLGDPWSSLPNRSTQLALLASQEAITAIGEYTNLRLGLVLATSVAGMTQSELYYRELRNNQTFAQNATRELKFHEPTAISGLLASLINAQGFHTISTACSSSLHALGLAKRLVERDRYDICLAVGVDALSLLTVHGFISLMLIDHSGCKPFDRQRIGTSLGEGAGALLLANKLTVQRLKIRPLAYISGWGASADGYHMSAPHPQGLGAQKAMQLALKEAKLEPDKISMVTAHGTATPDNDIAEVKALKSIFTPLPPFCSLKGIFGHTLAASGILETIYAICALRKDSIPSTPGFTTPDENLGATPSPGGKQSINHILKNSFGFGGNNASVIISKAQIQGE